MEQLEGKSVPSVAQLSRWFGAIGGGIASGATIAALVDAGLSLGLGVDIASGVLGGAGIGTLIHSLLAGPQRPVADGVMQIPEGGARVRAGRAPQETLRAHHGEYMWLSIGGYGLHQTLRGLGTLYECGHHESVGSVLIVENNVQEAEAFYRSVPEVYRDRIEFAYTGAFAGGMANKPPSWILDYADIYGASTEEAASKVVRQHLARNGNRAPSTVLLNLSLGGQAPLGLIALEQIRRQFEQSLVIGFTALPDHDRSRMRFKELKGAYERLGVFGWVVSDNLCPDPVAADWGMVAMVTGLVDAALHADQTTQPNNAFTLALPEKPGGILVYQVVTGSVAAYPFQPDPRANPQFWVFRQDVAEQILQELRNIERGAGFWSAALPVGEENTSTFDIVMCSLFPSDLHEVADYVTKGRKRRARVSPASVGDQASSGNGRLFGQANYGTIFASIATVVDPAGPICPVMTVRLAAVKGGDRALDQLLTSKTRTALKPGDNSQSEGTRDVRTTPLDELFLANAQRSLFRGEPKSLEAK